MSIIQSSTLLQVVEHHLCCGCGTCVAVCPADALRMVETPAGFLAPALDEDACTRCGRCMQACPGAMLAEENERAFEGYDDPFLGTILSAWWGRAKSPDIRREATSGGIVTTLVQHLLRYGEVEAALLTRWSPDDPLQQQAFIALTPEELESSQKSRYCPVALNTRLSELSEFDRVVVVGLPCHLQGIEHAGRLLDLPDMIRIGLFCDRTLSRLLIDRLSDLAGAAGDVECFEFRHNGQRGWPGDVYVRTGRGDEVFVDRSERMKRKDIYTPLRCRVCFDKFNVLADIVAGDGYGSPLAEEGVSAILARTERGKNIIEAARDDLELTEAPPEDVLREHHVAERRRDSVACATALRDLSSTAPEPLPAACRSAAEKPSREQVERCVGMLTEAIRFQTAADRAEALRIARKAERRRQLRQMGAKLGRLFGRVLGGRTRS